MLAYDYSESIAVLEERPLGELSPHLYLLCDRCADKLQPPLGWTLLDRRGLTEDVPRAEPSRSDPSRNGADPEPQRDYDQPLLFGESA